MANVLFTGGFPAEAAGILERGIAASAFTGEALTRAKANLERDRANQEAETSRRVTEFLEGLFKVSDPWAARDKEVSPRELLDAGAEQIETKLKDQPKVHARLMRTIGQVYGGLGMGEQAKVMLQRSLTLSEAAFGSDSLECAEVLHRDRRGRKPQARLRIRQQLLRPGKTTAAAAIGSTFSRG